MSLSPGETVTFQTLTPEEKLRLWRGRLGLTQGQAGRRFGVSAWVFGEMERGDQPVPGYAWRGEFALRDYEKCLIYRQRAGVHQDHIASELGCSRLWVGLMEAGKEPCTRLLQYWEI